MSPPNQLVFRLIVSLIIVLVLSSQAWRSPPRSYRRAAFTTAASAFGLLFIFTLQVVISNETAPWAIAVLWLVFLLMLASLILLGVSWRKGEMREKMEQVRQAVAEERKRREEANNNSS
jgi:signal transduction histidine kinase